VFMKFAIISARKYRAGSWLGKLDAGFLSRRSTSIACLRALPTASPALLTIDFLFPECYKSQDAQPNTLLLPFDQLLGRRPDQNGQARIIAGYCPGSGGGGAAQHPGALRKRRHRNRGAYPRRPRSE